MMVMILNWHNLEVKHGVIENIALLHDFLSHQESNILVVLPLVGANLLAEKCSLELTSSKQGTNLTGIFTIGIVLH